jgi:hypothetical protein
MRVQPAGSLDQEPVWQNPTHTPTSPFFERTSKRRKGFPSETQVKKGLRIVHGDKELLEKLGRNDPRPCGSLRKFKHCRMRTVSRRNSSSKWSAARNETSWNNCNAGQKSRSEFRSKDTHCIEISCDNL